MLFPNLILDSLVQICDMFRIDASKSFHGSGEVLTEINIYPDFVNKPTEFYNVYVENCPEEWILDYAYETAGEYTVRVELKTATTDKTKDYTVKAITEEEDNLQSDDSMIYALESELKNYLPAGRNSWKYLHREALNRILDWMYRNAMYDPEGDRITKDQLIGDKLSEWSKYEVMVLIFQELKTSNGDLFNEKIEDYSEELSNARAIYKINYDANRDGQVTDEDDKDLVLRPTHFRRGGYDSRNKNVYSFDYKEY